MKKLFFITGILTFFAFLLPVFSISGEPLLYGGTLAEAPPMEGAALAAVFSGGMAESAAPTEPAKTADRDILVKVSFQGEVLTLPMDEYLLSVVAAEMPADFPEEALKAQAIAARTFTLNRMLLFNTAPMREHPDAHTCADPAHCKAYLPLIALEDRWGELAFMYIEKIKAAVKATDGEVALYDSEPILAVFHAASSGRTERALDVWEGDVPYLQSVDSPGEEASPRYYGRAEIQGEEFREAFSASYPDARLPGDMSTWFQNIVRSEAGGVVTLSVGGVTVKGGVIRAMCGLLSTNFEISFSGDLIVFNTRGYGHGVGLSQYGARALSLEGKTAEDIIKWYYKGVEIGSFSLPES